MNLLRKQESLLRGGIGMKRVLLVLVLVICLLTASSCEGYADDEDYVAFTCDGEIMLTHTGPTGDVLFSCVLSEEDEQTFLRIWNEGDWVVELIECMPDYRITWEGNLIYYRTCCGIYTMHTDEGTLALDPGDADKAEVARMVQRYADTYDPPEDDQPERGTIQ